MQDALRYKKPIVYVKGSAADELLTADISVSLSNCAKVDEWVSAILYLYEISKEKDFLIKFQKVYDVMPSWKQTAFTIKKLYNEI